jgi:peptide/nickel transport system substrate-binding protein
MTTENDRKRTGRTTVRLTTLTLALAAAAFAAGAADAQTPRRGGALTATIDFQPKSLDPVLGDADTSDRWVYNQLFETLVRVDGDGRTQPLLATGWDVAPDGRTITLRLREGVTFHDGTPFDADAVAFNIARVQNPDTRSNRRQDVASIARVAVLGPHLVRLDLSEPSAAALNTLAAEGGYMVSPTAARKWGEDFGRNPVGTGPFRFVDWPGGERVNMRRFEGYWGRDGQGQPLPYLDEVAIRTVRQASVALLELQSGSVQLVNAITPRDAARVRGSSDLQVLPPRLLLNMMVALNTTRPPFDDADVRRAFARAVDRAALANAIGAGQGTVTPLFVAPNESAFDPDLKPLPHDPADARRLLAASGKTTVPVTLSVIQRDPDVQLAQIVQSQARAAGFDVRIEVLDRQAWLDKTARAKTHEAALLRAAVPKLDPHQTFAFYFGKGSGTNYSWQQDETVFDLVERAKSEIDPARRRGLYGELSRRLLDQSYFTFLFNIPFLNGARAEVRDLGQDVSGAWDLRAAWLAR